MGQDEVVHGCRCMLISVNAAYKIYVDPNKAIEMQISRVPPHCHASKPACAIISGCIISLGRAGLCLVLRSWCVGERRLVAWLGGDLKFWPRFYFAVKSGLV